MVLWSLQHEKQEGKKLVRTYLNSQTGSECKTYLILTDKDGRKWWGFMDLYKIPMIRVAMARHITDLYTIGLSLKDILGWCEQEKALIKGNDPEKYEKLYAMILEKEKLAKHTADPMKQHLALCTVYVLGHEERVDYFTEEVATEKLQEWYKLPELMTFFLTWHQDHIQRYLKTLDKISTTVLNLQEKEKAMISRARPKA